MKRIIVFAISSFFVTGIVGQVNFVPNPSFEDTANCPNDISINQSLGWLSFTQSPDYFNTCATGNFNAPNAYPGYQMPYDGKAFAGAVVNSLPQTSNLREYFGIHLTQPLTIGTKYYVTFYVSLADPPRNCWSNKIGARFTTYYFNGPNFSSNLINNFSHVKSDSLLKDATNWTKIGGSFTADSAYIYIVLGNFYNDLNTDTLNCANSLYTYAFFDMVCVSTNSTTCNSPLSTGANIRNKSISIFPNPCSSFINISVPREIIYEVSIINALGQELYHKNNSNSHRIEVSNFPVGFYTTIFTNASENHVLKIAVIR